MNSAPVGGFGMALMPNGEVRRLAESFYLCARGVCLRCDRWRRKARRDFRRFTEMA